MLRMDERTQFCLRIGWISHTNMRRALCYSLDKAVVDALLDQQPRTGGAAFTIQRENAEHGGIHRPLEVGIGEDDDGRFTTQFDRAALERCGGTGHDRFAGSGFAGERDQIDVWMGHQWRTASLAKAMYLIED